MSIKRFRNNDYFHDIIAQLTFQ